MEAFLVSSLVVGLAEIGDKTQILSLILAARFQRPAPIILGILVATRANHAAAGWVGRLFGSLLGGEWIQWILGISFLGVAVWALFPDKYEGRAERVSLSVPLPQRSSRFFWPRSATRRRSPQSGSLRGSGNSTRW